MATTQDLVNALLEADHKQTLARLRTQPPPKPVPPPLIYLREGELP